MAGEGRRTALSKTIVASEEAVGEAGGYDDRGTREGCRRARVGQRETDRSPHVDVDAESRFHGVDFVLGHLAAGVAREGPVRPRGVPHVDFRVGLAVERRALQTAGQAPEGDEAADDDEDLSDEAPDRRQADVEAEADEDADDRARDGGDRGDSGLAVGAGGAEGGLDLSEFVDGGGHDAPHNRCRCGRSAYLGVGPTHEKYYSINAYACKYLQLCHN